MHERFTEMPCFLLAGSATGRSDDFEFDGELTRLERRYRRYATIFEKVILIINPEDAREWYLNYPYVCKQDSDSDFKTGVAAALKAAGASSVFIDCADLESVPLEALVHTVRTYDGEPHLGITYSDLQYNGGVYRSSEWQTIQDVK